MGSQSIFVKTLIVIHKWIEIIYLICIVCNIAYMGVLLLRWAPEASSTHVCGDTYILGFFLLYCIVNKYCIFVIEKRKRKKCFFIVRSRNRVHCQGVVSDGLDRGWVLDGNSIARSLLTTNYQFSW